MANHPNRSKKGGAGTGANPTKEKIKAAREAAGLTQTEAANFVYSTLRTWQDWEAGVARMHAGLWELFCIKVKKTVDAPQR